MFIMTRRKSVTLCWETP